MNEINKLKIKPIISINTAYKFRYLYSLNFEEVEIKNKNILKKFVNILEEIFLKYSSQWRSTWLIKKLIKSTLKAEEPWKEEDQIWISIWMHLIMWSGMSWKVPRLLMAYHWSCQPIVNKNRFEIHFSSFNGISPKN